MDSLSDRGKVSKIRDFDRDFTNGFPVCPGKVSKIRDFDWEFTNGFPV